MREGSCRSLAFPDGFGVSARSMVIARDEKGILPDMAALNEVEKEGFQKKVTELVSCSFRRWG